MKSLNVVPTKSRSPFRTVFTVTSGNFLEMFDFFLFGFYATSIAKAFFPAHDELSSLLMTFMTFGAGFLMRPLGAVVLGAYIDRHGRRRGLILTLGLMAMGTLLLTCVPDYSTIGLFAPFLVLVGRLLQGFSAGVELGGVSVYLLEYAPADKKGFYVSWQSASQQVAIVAAAALGFFLEASLAPAELLAWGWRIPFGLGCLIVPALFMIRRSLEETEVFKNRTEHLTPKAIFRSVLKHWRLVVTGMFLVSFSTVSFYLITVYTPTYGKSVLHLTSRDSLIVTFCVGISNFLWLPVMGSLTDRIGRRIVLYFPAVLAILTAYPALRWLGRGPTFSRMLLVELWLSFLYASYNGAMVVALTEQMPLEVRTSGFSLAYSLATALFGGFTPPVSTALIEYSGDRASPALWMTLAAVFAVGATTILYRRRNAITLESSPI